MVENDCTIARADAEQLDEPGTRASSLRDAFEALLELVRGAKRGDGTSSPPTEDGSESEASAE